MELNKDIIFFLKKQRINFRKVDLYVKAFTHPSFSNEKDWDESYQKLEFLGDAVIGFLVVDYIYKKYSNLNEGQMSILKTNMVNKETLKNISLDLKLDKILRVGNSMQEIPKNSKIFSDIFESLIGAIYLDVGIKAVKNFLSKNIFKLLDKSKGQNQKNPKSILQEYLQLTARGTIIYETKRFRDIFKSSVYQDGNKYGKGKGKTKKEAEINAAKNALKKVEELNETNKGRNKRI